jgi:hypothetical protein
MIDLLWRSYHQPASDLPESEMQPGPRPLTAPLHAVGKMIVEIPTGTDEVAKQTKPLVDQCSAMFHELVGAGEDFLSLRAGGLHSPDEGQRFRGHG